MLLPMGNSYQVTLDQARSELIQLTEQRKALDVRIAALTRSIEGLAILCDEHDDSAQLLSEPGTKLATTAEISSPEPGISDAIRNILAASILPITVPEIRNTLVAEGFDADAYSNMLTVIHNTLRRLERQGEAQIVVMPFSGSGRWVATSQLGKRDKTTAVSTTTLATLNELKREAAKRKP